MLKVERTSKFNSPTVKTEKLRPREDVLPTFTRVVEAALGPTIIKTMMHCLSAECRSPRQIAVSCSLFTLILGGIVAGMIK